MHAFSHPPLLSPNTIVATVMRVARGLGIALPTIRTLLGHASTDQRKRRIFAGYEPSEHDVFVATFPKSGTNWAMQLAVQIAWRGEAEFEHIHEVVAWPEARLAGIVPLHDPGPQQRCPTGKRAIKTAIDAAFVPYREHATYLTVLRDPKDVFVSTYHFIFGIFDLVDDITMEEWLALFLSPQFPGGSWAQHAASYWAWRERPNVRVLLFSEMKQDLPGTVGRVAEAMGVSLTDAELRRVVERCSFDTMQRNEQRFAPPRMLFTRQHGTMVRAGKVGASGELLTRQQQAAIDRHCQGELGRLGSDLPYAELFEVIEG
jgi:hypothetical protein